MKVLSKSQNALPKRLRDTLLVKDNPEDLRASQDIDNFLLLTPASQEFSSDNTSGRLVEKTRMKSYADSFELRDSLDPSGGGGIPVADASITASLSPNSKFLQDTRRRRSEAERKFEDATYISKGELSIKERAQASFQQARTELKPQAARRKSRLSKFLIEPELQVQPEQEKEKGSKQRQDEEQRGGQDLDITFKLEREKSLEGLVHDPRSLSTSIVRIDDILRDSLDKNPQHGLKAHTQMQRDNSVSTTIAEEDTLMGDEDLPFRRREKEDESDAAATKLQSAFRGHMGRKETLRYDGNTSSHHSC